jgi:hypothetical protein
MAAISYSVGLRPGHPASPRNRGRTPRGTAAHGDDITLAASGSDWTGHKGQEGAMTMKKPLYSTVLAIVLDQMFA